MIDFTNFNCSSCGNKFKKDDDIVVCPKCGAPYHKECYNKEGHCKFYKKHDSGFRWEPPQKSTENKTQCEEIPNCKKNCKRCNCLNDEDAIFCKRCGFPFVNSAYVYNQGTHIDNNPPFMADPLGGIKPDEKIEDVPAKEVATFVKVNTPYYLSVFKKLKDFNTSRFNFCAFLFSGGWMLYRKQYFWGTIITLLFGIFTFSSSYISHNYTLPILKTMLSSVNLDINTVSIPDMASVISNQLPEMPLNKILLLIAPSVLSILNWIIMFIVGFLGNRLYFKHCISKIKSLKNSLKGEEYINGLKVKGGVNTQLGICLFICYVIILLFL